MKLLVAGKDGPLLDWCDPVILGHVVEMESRSTLVRMLFAKLENFNQHGIMKEDRNPSQIRTEQG
jgi:hypothetical protein